MHAIHFDPTLLADLADATKRAELLKDPRAFLEQYSVDPEQAHTSTLMSRLPGLADVHMQFNGVHTMDSARTTGSLNKALDPHWQ